MKCNRNGCRYHHSFLEKCTIHDGDYPLDALCVLDELPEESRQGAMEEAYLNEIGADDFDGDV